MKNEEEITLDSNLFGKYVNDDKVKIMFTDKVKFKFTDFLTNGDLVIYIEFNRKSIILIYPANNIKNNEWMCDSIYEFKEKEIIFGGITHDNLWILSNKSIFVLDLLDLSALQHRKIPLEIN